MNNRFYRGSHWKLNPKTDETIENFIQSMHDLIFDESCDLGKLEGFEYVEDEKVAESEKLGLFRNIKIGFGGRNHHLGIFFYNRHNGNCLAVYSFDEGKNFIQLVLDKYIDYSSESLYVWHDAVITGLAGLTKEKALAFVKSKNPHLIKKDEKDLDFVDLGVFPKPTEITDLELNTFLSNLLQYCLLRGQLKKEMKLASDPVVALLEKYKIHLKENHLSGELYKWKLLKKYKGRPDINPEDFYEEIKGIDFSNLIYPVGISVIHHIAKDRTEAYRACFRILFDKNKPLLERVKYFNEETLKIYRELVPEEKFSHHQDERTIATFLTYHNPDEYTLFKDSFYQKYCKLISVKPKKKGEKYVHYLELIEEVIENYLIEDMELLSLVNEQIPEGYFKDDSHKLLAQDFLYQTLDKQVGEDRTYWRIGTSDPTTSYWDFMKPNNKICIGWSEIGDLNEANIKNKKDIGELLKSEGFYPGDKRTLSRKAGEIYNFYNDVKVGDVVLAQDGSKVLGIGIISDEYTYNGNDGFAHQKDIEWKVDDPNLYNKEGVRTSVYKLTDITVRNKVASLIENKTPIGNQDNQNFEMNIPQNQILYGPPGTGKTYLTINKALEIIGENIEGESRESIKALFDKKMKEGQIVFTTFHQSMSYEDFIEGIKPVKPEQEDTFIKYEVQAGIFKKICQAAKTPNLTAFDSAYERLIKNLSEGSLLTLQTPTGKDFAVSLNQNNNLNLHTGPERAKNGTLTKENIQKEINGEEKFIGWEGYFKGVIEHLKSNYQYSENGTNKTKSYVLIIDEINRGNVSQIFGELITLIEENKRIGMTEVLEVTLPYSKEKFGVPANLYIIGTMNTADRSVEALDAALRRRFSFEEMPPLYDLPELKYEYGGTQVSRLLETINNRIEKLLDKDHKIGHSYFIRKEDEQPGNKLLASFYEKIIPLLQEYFFGDYGKIGLVLGEGFVRLKDWSKDGDSFAEFSAESPADFDEKPVYQIIDYRDIDHGYKISFKEKKDVSMTFEKAIQLLMKQAIE